MATLAALGFKLHTGWAVVVAITGAPGKVPARLEVLLRRRIELLPPGDSVPRFVYHQAAELASTQATELIERAEAAAQKTASAAVKDLIDHLRAPGVAVKSAGIAGGSKPVPQDLAAVLRSHPLIHTAEAALFQRAIASACTGSALAIVSVREREVWSNAASAWSLKEAGLRQQVEGLRKSVGAPWGSDQKTATAFALLALRSHQ